MGSAMSNDAKSTLLIVDDQPENLAVLSTLLQPHYLVRAARSGQQALRAVTSRPKPDLILLDVMMPEMDGYAVLAKLREAPLTADIPVIFITALVTEEDEQRGFNLGAVDYITKPIKPAVVLARVRTQLELKQARDRLAEQNALLETRVVERTQALKQALGKVESAHAALKKSYFGTLMAISALTELRGAFFGERSRRVADVSRKVANFMGLSEADAQTVFIAALLHDIGKIGFTDELLRKPVNKMNVQELTLYRRHPALAADALGKIESLKEIAAIVRYHHERYDGSGFPEGRSGLDIPLGARIICAVSDYDDFRHGGLTALPMTQKESHRYLIEGRGRRYDPSVIDQLEPVLKFDEVVEIDEIKVSAKHLQESMMLTRDVMHPDGFLLLSMNTVLDLGVIDQLATVERDASRSLEIWVLRNRIL
jgi:putative two-component system response regulator